jgi:hypothetical protein
VQKTISPWFESAVRRVSSSPVEHDLFKGGLVNSALTRRTLLVLLVLLGSSALAAAQGVGAIGGTVVDSSGAILPGATVALLNPGLIGGTQTTVTDERGAYLFTRLVPGRYNVRAELSGFRPMVQEGIIVNADATARADLRLELGNVQESITVSGQSPLLDTTSALNQTVMERQVLDVLPGTNDLWGVARLVPSITMNKYDVGGSESFQQSKISVHGSNPDGESQYQIDGMNIDAAVGATGNVTMYYDPFMFEEINYQTSNGSAETARGGIVYNMITKTGTNVLRGAYMFNGSNQHLQSDNISDAQRADLLAQIPPKALAANPDLTPASKILKIFDTGATFSGPVLRDRLWWSASTKFVGLDQLRLGSYNPDGTQFVDDNFMATVSGKGSWAINPHNQLHFTHIYNDKRRYHYAGNATVGFYESSATWNQTLETNLDQARWTSSLSGRLLLDVSGSFSRTLQDLPPQDAVGAGTIPGLDLTTQTTLAAMAVYTEAHYNRGVFHGGLSYVAGTHNLKLGYQWDLGQSQGYNYSLSNYPSGFVAVFQNSVPSAVRAYNTPTWSLQRMLEHGLFVQDKWTPSHKLTINAGARLDRQTSWQPEACQPQTIFISGQCFAAIDNTPDWLDIAPRFAAIYDVFGDGRTAIKFGANRYMLGIGSGTIDLVNPIRTTFDTRSWTDRNKDGVPQADEVGPSTGFNLGTTNRYVDGFERPYAAEYSIEFEQQIMRDTVVSAAYFRRGVRRNIGSRNVAVPTDSYIPLNVTEVVSGRNVTVYNLNPALRGKFDVVWNNYPELDSDFNGLDLTINKRFSRNWMLITGVSFGDNKGDIYNPANSDLNNPNFQFRHGILGNQVPIAIKVSGSYQAPYGILASAVVQHYTGFPELTTVSVGPATVALTQVTQSITVEPRGTTRLPDVNLVDFNVKKTIKAGGSLSIQPAVEVFNLLNSSATQSRNTVLGPAYGRVASIVLGRMVKFGVNVNF